MSNRKKMNKYEVFEQSFKTQIPGKSQKVVASNKKEGSLMLGIIFLPFIIFAKVMKFCVIGLSERDFYNLSYAKSYSALSGMFMLFSSILALFFINDIGLFIKSVEVVKDHATLINAFLVIFFIVQIIRGSAFIKGYNIGQGGAISGSKWYNPNIPSSSSFSHTSSRNSEIDDFKGYVNSKMSMMSNSDKESYVKSLFGGK